MTSAAPPYTQEMAPKEEALEVSLRLLGRGIWQLEHDIGEGKHELWVGTLFGLKLSSLWRRRRCLKQACRVEEVLLARSKGVDSEII